MKRIYVTTIPLQGRLDLTKNTYRSSANSGDIETRFPILQVLHNTLQEGDDFHIIAIRSVNGDSATSKRNCRRWASPRTTSGSCPCRTSRTAAP